MEMMGIVRLWILALALFLFAISSTLAKDGDIVINEIMYHPPNDLEAEEFVELHNIGKTLVNLSDWEFTKGISYTFPEGVVIEPGGYLVVCRSLDGFRAVYGADAIASGNFRKTFSNSGEEVTLSNSAGEVVDRVQYADRVPWAVGADGYSASLERICPSAKSEASNWASSLLPADKPRPTGTPGRRNACYSEKPLPVVSEVEFSPQNPKPDQPVVVWARITDGSKAVLLYRMAKSGYEGEEMELPMKPDADGRHKTAIPGQSGGFIVRFRIKATGDSGAVRFEPHENGLRPAYSYFTYANTESAAIPIGFIVNVSAESYQLARRNEERERRILFRSPDGNPPPRPPAGRRRGRPRPPRGGDMWGGPPRRMGRPGSRPSPPPRGSSAFVYVSPNTGAYQIYDYINVLPRKGGYKVRFHKDHPLNEMTTINLLFEYMPRFALAEHLSYEVYKRAGVPTEHSEYVRLSIDDHLLGYHLLVEQPNRNFLRRQNRDDAGNLYKLLWYKEGVVEQHEKKTNLHTGHDDVVNLVAALENTKGEEQWNVIRKHFDVEEIMSYFAVSLCISNWDGFWNNYFAYHDIGGSGKWEIYPWDEDKTWGYYDMASPGEYLYDMPLTFGMDEPLRFWERRSPKGGPNWGRPGKPIWWRPGGYFSGPILANKYFRAPFLARLKEITETIYTEAVFIPIIDELEKKLEPEVRIRAAANGQNVDTMLGRFHRNIRYLKEHLIKRRDFILSRREIKKVGVGI